MQKIVSVGGMEGAVAVLVRKGRHNTEWEAVEEGHSHGSPAATAAEEHKLFSELVVCQYSS